MGSKLAPPSSSLGAAVIAVSFFQWISVFCILIILNKYKNLHKKQEHNEKHTSDPKHV
jgi:hypothetical protein